MARPCAQAGARARASARVLAGLLLALCAAGPAFALGLGQIQVRSQAGEPLLAEIPVVSSDPAELQQLRARLASPETFARIGLEPPQGAVSDLQFSVALDARGRPVIRVTTLAPVQDPLLTFLIEVDWGQGRLVREYSALLDAPATVAAPAQPPIQAPLPAQAPGAGAIVRDAAPAQPEPDPAAVAAADPTPAEPASDPAAVDAAVPEPAPAREPVADEDAVAPTPVASAAPAPPVPVAATSGRSTPGLYGPVQAGDTLSQIAQRIAPDDDVTVNQMMLALLRSNPEAFIGGNVNLVREGAVLRIPTRDETVRLGARQATAEIAAQVARWRELSQPAPQPAAIPLEGAADAAPAAAAPAATAARDARLEIVPPTAGGAQQAGTRSGIAAGGEGDMLRQELQQTQETLAARDAEVEELKARLDELERLQRQQQELIALKDSELAAAQQRLETSNRETAPPAEAGGAMPWIFGGIAGLLVALAVVWLLRRRADRTPAFRAPPPSSAPAAAAQPPAPVAPPPAGSPTWHAAAAPVSAAAAGLAAADPAGERAAAAPPAAEDLAPSPATVAAIDEVPADGAPDHAAPDHERIELARAYVELGDPETARSLLREVVEGGSAPARAEAEALLRQLDAAPPAS
ncbi:ferrous iron transporter B [Luteimonas sp. Y-2-2-4F]|nr:FimV/HubP family polar landmark protein [Luteimonas sp. Y-2-2-4F]MCD9030942.1 ferrous iron transporter B [Luteimonas sp. Y-2-2-4F]